MDPTQNYGKSTFPLVSIVLTVYNGIADGLNECLGSIFQQSFPNIQLVIVDDCSSDGSSKLSESAVNSIGGEYIRHIVNLGLSKSLNDGIKASQGEYILILQQDCFLLGDNCIRDAIVHLENESDIDILIGRQKYYFENLNFYQKFIEFRLGHIYLNTILKEQIGLTENKCDLLKRKTMSKIGFFDEKLRLSGEDQIFSHKANELGLKMIISDWPMYSNSLSGENSFRKLIRKEKLYGKYSSPLFFRIYSKKSRDKIRIHYVKEKITNRFMSMIIAPLLLISIIFSLLFTNIFFLTPIFIGLFIRGWFIMRDLKMIKKTVIDLKIGIIRPILFSIFLDLVYSIYFIYGMVIIPK
jgi:glycosyltransferase involved in cell wall biosynthesis